MGKGLVLSLFDRTGNMVRPWADAGYDCVIVDLQHPYGMAGTSHSKIKSLGIDILGMTPWTGVDIVFAFPPCTHLAAAGARWYKDKGLEALHEALGLVIKARQLCEAAGAPWMLENPVGVLSTYWRDPDFMFDPCEFGGYLEPEGDHYTKKTCLWTGGGFKFPEKRPVKPVLGSKMAYVSQSKDRANIRSVTPEGFAKAVFLANTGQVPGVARVEDADLTLDDLGL